MTIKYTSITYLNNLADFDVVREDLDPTGKFTVAHAAGACDIPLPIFQITKTDLESGFSSDNTSSKLVVSINSQINTGDSTVVGSCKQLLLAFINSESGSASQIDGIWKTLTYDISTTITTFATHLQSLEPNISLSDAQNDDIVEFIFRFKGGPRNLLTVSTVYTVKLSFKIVSAYTSGTDPLLV